MARKKSTIRNLVCVSDLHAGCQLGLCPPQCPALDGGGHYRPSKYQRRMWAWWTEFWDEWVPMVCRREKYAVAIVGDALDGRHHKSVGQISQNLADQARIAEAILRPIAERCRGRFYMIRGTEAHVGPSGEAEEQLAERLGAVPDENGLAARFILWKRVGRALVNLAHHIGTTGSQHYETTAIHKELTELYTEAARWGDEPPDVVIRAHRHRYALTEVFTDKGRGESLCLPGWQLKTPFAYRIPGGRQTEPQLGGVVVRQGDEEHFTRARVWRLDRPREE